MNLIVNISDITTSVIIVATVAFFYIYYYFTSSRLPEIFCASIKQPAHKIVAVFMLKKLAGFLLLGLIPGVFYFIFVNQDFKKFGFSFVHFSNNLLLIFSLVITISIVLFFNQKANRKNNSLQIKLSEWNFLLFLVNTMGWTIYLIGYEFLFRGILLFECYNSFGFWPAVAINIAIYSAIHMVNGIDQTIGSLFFGSIACYLAISFGSILIPLIMHVSLSVLSDYFSIRYNTSLNFIKHTSFKFPEK